MSVQRGYTLVEMMIAVTILAIGANLLVGAFQAYEAAGHRARAVAAIAEVLNQEMEAARACGSQACVRDLVSRGGTRHPAQAAGRSWLRPQIERRLRNGPDGTMELTITAEIPNVVPPRTLVALLEPLP